jgi:hypothetical protein
LTRTEDLVSQLAEQGERIKIEEGLEVQRGQERLGKK